MLRILPAFLALVIGFSISTTHALVVEPTSGPPLQPTTGLVQYFGSSGVAVGKHWVLTAKHVDWGGLVYMDGVPYTVDGYHPSPGFLLDLALLHIREPLPRWSKITKKVVQNGETVVMGGNGFGRGQPHPQGGWYYGVQGINYGKNRVTVEACQDECPLIMSTGFSRAGSSADPQVPYEAQATHRDSGGGIFVTAADGSLELAGIMTNASVGLDYVLYGAGTYARYLRAPEIQAFIMSIAPEVLVSFPRVDFNQDGTVQAGDIFQFLDAWFAALPSADFDGSGSVGPTDIFTFLDEYFDALG